MKKLFMLLALVLGVVSCQNEPEGFGVVVGGEQDVNITVSLPESTRGDSADGFDLSKLSDLGYELRYILEIYLDGGDDNKRFREVKYSDATTVSFPVRLAPSREYHFAVWADLVKKVANREEDADADYYYETSAGLKNITIDVTKWTPNVEARDAFYGKAALTTEQSIANLPTIKLTRPFAKVRVVATDIEDVRKFGIEPTGANVEYTSELYTSFNAVEGTVGATTTKTHTFYYNEDVDTYDDATGQMTVFADYILIPASGGTVQFKLDVNAANGLIKSNSFNTAIPVEANKVTSIVGDVLTEGGNVSIKIDGELGEGETINYVEVDNAEELVEAIENIENGMIKLGEDVNLDDLLNAGILATRAEKQYGLQIPANKTVILDLNGKKIYQQKAQSGKYAMIENNGTLTICNSANTNGTLSYGDTATLTADVGYASNTIQNNGVLTINEGVVIKNTSGTAVATYGYPHVIDTNGTLTINGGTLTNEANYSTMRIWTSNTDAEKCNVTINGGTFNGCIDFQAHNNNYNTIPHYGTLTVNGGTFNADTFTNSAIRVLRFGVNANDMHANINGGTFNGKVWVRNFGTFESTPKIFDIYNGTFTIMYEGFDTLLANGYAFVEGENGTYTVENVGHYTDTDGNEHITTAAGLLWFAGEVNKYSNYERPFENVTIYLENDIDLDGIEWTPIGDYRFSANRFCGTFDGQHHTISNFQITKKTDKNDSNKSSYGFFGNLEGTVKNVKVSNANVESYAYTAALVGRFNNGLIENCHVVDCAVSNTYWQGGILIGQTNAEGEVAAIVRNCSVSNSSITSKSAIGAISGPVTATKGGRVVFDNCSVADCTVNQEGSFSGNYDKYFGSMFGYTETDANSSIEINNFTVSNTTVKGESNAPISGDFDGNITIDGCKMVTVDTEEGLVAAVKDGKNVILGADIEIDSTIKVANDQTVTIDLNGHNITSKIAGKPSSFELFSVNGEFEIKGNGTISLTSEDFEWNASYRYTAINIREKGVVTLGKGVSVICEASKDGSYGMSYAVDIYTTGKLNINGASLHSNYIAVRCFYGNSVVNVNSGSKITSSKNNYGIWLQSSPGAVVTIADDVNHTFENDIYYFN